MENTGIEVWQFHWRLFIILNSVASLGWRHFWMTLMHWELGNLGILRKNRDAQKLDGRRISCINQRHLCEIYDF